MKKKLVYEKTGTGCYDAFCDDTMYRMWIIKLTNGKYSYTLTNEYGERQDYGVAKDLATAFKKAEAMWENFKKQGGLK
jgi:hypothetical protein